MERRTIHSEKSRIRNIPLAVSLGVTAALLLPSCADAEPAPVPVEISTPSETPTTEVPVTPSPTEIIETGSCLKGETDYLVKYPNYTDMLVEEAKTNPVASFIYRNHGEQPSIADMIQLGEGNNCLSLEQTKFKYDGQDFIGPEQFSNHYFELANDNRNVFAYSAVTTSKRFVEMINTYYAWAADPEQIDATINYFSPEGDTELTTGPDTFVRDKLSVVFKDKVMQQEGLSAGEQATLDTLTASAESLPSKVMARTQSKLNKGQAFEKTVRLDTTFGDEVIGNNLASNVTYSSQTESEQVGVKWLYDGSDPNYSGPNALIKLIDEENGIDGPTSETYYVVLSLHYTSDGSETPKMSFYRIDGPLEAPSKIG